MLDSRSCESVQGPGPGPGLELGHTMIGGPRSGSGSVQVTAQELLAHLS